MPARPRKDRTGGLMGFELAYLLDDSSLVDHRWQESSLWRLQRGESATASGKTVCPKSLWQAHKNEFLPMFIEKHPGKRPAPFWQYEAPEPRQQGGGPKNNDWVKMKKIHGENAPAIRLLNWKFNHGIPGRLNLEIKDKRIFESQAAYLKRLDLLTPGELELIPEQEFLPVLLADMQE